MTKTQIPLYVTTPQQLLGPWLFTVNSNLLFSLKNLSFQEVLRNIKISNADSECRILSKSRYTQAASSMFPACQTRHVWRFVEQHGHLYLRCEGHEQVIFHCRWWNYLLRPRLSPAVTTLQVIFKPKSQSTRTDKWQGLCWKTAIVNSFKTCKHTKQM